MAAESTGTRPPLLPRVVLAAMAVILVAAVVLDWHRVKPVLQQANWHLVPIALLLTAVSYACSSSGFAVVNRAFGIPVALGRLRLVGFVTMTVINLITLGGAAGYSVSAVLLKRRDIPLRDILAASTFHFYLYFLTGTTCLPASLAYVVLSHRIPARAELGMTVLVAAALVLAALVNLAVFWRRFRTGTLSVLRRVIRRFARRDIAPQLDGFDETFTLGMAALRSQPGHVAQLVAFVAGDWLFCLAALWLCFGALGSFVHPGILLSGFFIGIAAGGASMVPGGIGVQEASMTGIYALLGIPLELALLAAILFRFVYYLVPFAVGLPVYRYILRTADPDPGIETAGPARP